MSYALNYYMSKVWRTCAYFLHSFIFVWQAQPLTGNVKYSTIKKTCTERFPLSISDNGFWNRLIWNQHATNVRQTPLPFFSFFRAPVSLFHSVLAWFRCTVCAMWYRSININIATLRSSDTTVLIASMSHAVAPLASRGRCNRTHIELQHTCYFRSIDHFRRSIGTAS